VDEVILGTGSGSLGDDWSQAAQRREVTNILVHEERQ
jgi:hypothetical protein